MHSLSRPLYAVCIALVCRSTISAHFERTGTFGVSSKITQQHVAFLLHRGGSDIVEEATIKDAKVDATNETIEEVEAVESDVVNANKTADKWVFAACIPGDGSESDPDGLPRRFLKMQKQNRKRAIKALNDTLTWRAQHEVDTILSRPHPLYDIGKAVVPHYFCGRDPDNRIVFIQQPALINVDQCHRNNLTMPDLLMHYVYVLEYCWNIEEPRPDQTMTSVIDLTGISFGKLMSGELFGFVKRFISMMSSHYPSRSYKTLITNTPGWFGATYKLISPILRESTKAKIEIHSRGKRQDKALKKYLGEDLVPESLLSTSASGKALDLSNSTIEQNLRNFCVARLNEARIEMKEVIP